MAKKPYTNSQPSLAPMASSIEPQDGSEVSRVRERSTVTTGKPRRLSRTASMRLGFTNSGLGGGGTTQSAGGNFYSAEMSTDFLELPRSMFEQWNTYRLFYKTNPFVGQAIDLHTELPLSKVRISMPIAKDRNMAVAAQRFCENWTKRVHLLQRLISIVHDYYLIGEVWVFAEDANPEMPEDLLFDTERTLDANGNLQEKKVQKQDTSAAVSWMKKNYKGWTALRCLPPEQIHQESFNFTDEKMVEMIPDAKTKGVVAQADAGDPRAQRIVASMPPDVVSAVRDGTNIMLQTDPEAGSFVHYLANKKSDYAPRGQSILERCLRALTEYDKIRQAQAQIASRHMTPNRIVYAEDMDAQDTENLREQVDMSLQDPDFSIIANFQITWEEMGSQSRLLDMSPELDIMLRSLYAGLGVTEGLLTGESSYSGDRISLEVINTRYMLLREILQEYVQEYLFKPMCKRMGFIEEDEDGNEVVVSPNLTFSRLALQDNADTFEHLYTLYSKGSLPVSDLLGLLNIDPVSAKEGLLADTLTLNDAASNEAIRSMYSAIGNILGDPKNSDATEKFAKSIGLKYTPPPDEDEGGGRF